MSDNLTDYGTPRPPDHMSFGHLVRKPEQPAVNLEQPVVTLDEFGKIFDDHLHIFFTNYVKQTRRIAIPVPVFAGSTNLGIYGVGYILGYSFTGTATGTASVIDSKSGFTNPLISAGVAVNLPSTVSFAYPLQYKGELSVILTDPSIQGVLYIEKVISD